MPFPSGTDHFAVLDLPRTPQVDAGLLQRRFYDLNRRLHPDLFQTGTAAERQASLRNTAAVNEAYRTLRDAEERGLYWLGLHGESLRSDSPRVPGDMAALVFEVQEKLDEVRGGDAGARVETESIRQDLAGRRRAWLADVNANFAAWDEASPSPTSLLAELKALLAKLAYLNTLIRDVDQVLENEWTGSSESTSERRTA